VVAALDPRLPSGTPLGSVVARGGGAERWACVEMEIVTTPVAWNLFHVDKVGVDRELGHGRRPSLKDLSLIARGWHGTCLPRVTVPAQRSTL